MDYSELNCCDYDAIVHYPPGSFNAKYKTILEGNVVDAEQEAILPEWLANSFENKTYHTFITKVPLFLYRIFGQIAASNHPAAAIKGARSLGVFASTEFAESRCDAKLRLALKPQWLNTQMYEEKILLPANQTIIVGKVASVPLLNGELLPGGAEQVILPKDWSEEWIVGYRRVTGRQLQIAPKYNYGKPPLFDIKGEAGYKGNNRLFRIMCPRCGSENIRKLEEDERFTFVGSEGGNYIMYYTCLETDCRYYW